MMLIGIFAGHVTETSDSLYDTAQGLRISISTHGSHLLGWMDHIILSLEM